MGNEPDEEQQMIHMLTNSNEFDLEGLIAVTGKYLRTDPQPELFIKLINAYEKVVDNLKKHADGWPEPKYLRSIVKAGQSGYGIDDVGKGKSSPGSKLLVDAITNEDPRPIWVVVNAGSNTLAQALVDLKAKRSPEEMDAFVAKLRVFENGSQDNAGSWICANFPKIHWIRSNYQTYCYGGPSNNILGPYVWEPHPYSVKGHLAWEREHIMNNHGALGDIYPIRQLEWNKLLLFHEGGGTIPWLGLVNKGLFSIDHPEWGGWAGRFTATKVKNFWSRHADIKVDEERDAPFYVYREASDTWTDPVSNIRYSDDHTPVWRWRRAQWNNQKCRMDWCVKDWEEANHHPKAAFGSNRADGIIRLTASVDETIELNADRSRDMDGDLLSFHWWMYREAGTFTGELDIEDPRAVQTSVTIPSSAHGKQIHIILEVEDDNEIAPLTDYRRIVIDVE